jgi:hypothetical protein
MSPSKLRLPKPDGGPAERAAWAFYTLAALGSTIGQIWVGVDVPPWPAAMPVWLRAVMVLPFAVVLDLGGVVCSAFADTRQRKGEGAYGWRILSAAAVCLGVGINIVGHATVPYLAVVFGGLGVFAYAVWLLHSAARRRDALRADHKLADTAPVYGWSQWRREPEVTRRAKNLALEYGYSMFESLAEARIQLRNERRHAALAAHIETDIKARHDDKIKAAIAVTTMDIGAIAAKLMALSDSDGWARSINAGLAPPPLPPAPAGRQTHPLPAAPQQATDSAAPGYDLPQLADPDLAAVPVPSSAVLRQIPAEQHRYDKWRQVWQAIAEDPGQSN